MVDELDGAEAGECWRSTPTGLPVVVMAGLEFDLDDPRLLPLIAQARRDEPDSGEPQGVLPLEDDDGAAGYVEVPAQNLRGSAGQSMGVMRDAALHPQPHRAARTVATAIWTVAGYL